METILQRPTDTRFADHKRVLSIQEYPGIYGYFFFFHIEPTLNFPTIYNIYRQETQYLRKYYAREQYLVGTNICDVFAGCRVSYFRDPI